MRLVLGLQSHLPFHRVQAGVYLLPLNGFTLDPRYRANTPA